MTKLRDMAFARIKSVDEKLVATVCGSFRRGAVSSGDIDILMGHPDYTSEVKKKPEYVKRVVAAMEAGGFVTDTLSLGETKFMASWRGLDGQKWDSTTVACHKIFCDNSSSLRECWCLESSI